MGFRKTLESRGQGQETVSYPRGYEHRGQTVKIQHMDNLYFRRRIQNK